MPDLPVPMLRVSAHLRYTRKYTTDVSKREGVAEKKAQMGKSNMHRL